MKKPGVEALTPGTHGQIEISNFGIADVSRQVVEVYTLGTQGWALSTTYTEHQEISPVLDGTESGLVGAAEMTS